MAIWAIGDIQGCYDELRRLLDRIAFEPERDTLWFTGDLVNRGPRSLETLRFVRGLGSRAVTVLGNHDLHLLAVAHGHGKKLRHDTLAPILEAPDRDELIHWLRHRPLLHHDEVLATVMVHAGLPPQWDLATARACAAELEAALRGPDHLDFIRVMYGNRPDRWDPALEGIERLRFITNAFTRTRFCYPDGRLDFAAKGPPGSQPPGLVPWFALPDRCSRGIRIVFGHWSTLPTGEHDGVVALDGGCLWGGRLVAARLDLRPPAWVSLDCEGACEPGP